MARLLPIKQEPKRRFGTLKGKVAVDDAFFDPLPPEELEIWGQ